MFKNYYRGSMFYHIYYGYKFYIKRKSNHQFSLLAPVHWYTIFFCYQPLESSSSRMVTSKQKACCVLHFTKSYTNPKV